MSGSGWDRHWYLPWIFSYGDSSGLQPRCADKTIFPGERQAWSFVLAEMLVQEQWKLCIVNTENVLWFFSSVHKHTGEPREFPKPWSCCPFWQWRVFGPWRGGGRGFLLKIMKAMCRTVHYFWGPWKYYSGDLTHHYRLYGANHSTGDFSISLIDGLHSS